LPAFERLVRPQPVALAGRQVLVLGIGDSGLAAARWIAEQGGKVRGADSRPAPPRAAEFRAALPWAELRCGPFSEALLEGAELVCVSPGLALDEPIVQAALARGLPVLGEIELFAWAVRARPGAKIIAVTGTNGKSTVTALAAHLARATGLDAVAAGNLGPPALEAYMRPRERPVALWVLELSSFQLETTWSLAPEAAALLNVSPDHLDRYPDLDAYARAKARVFLDAHLQLVNRDDARSRASALPGRRTVTFGLEPPPGEEDFGLREGWLVRGGERILPLSALPLHGLHNAANALAACALASAAGAPLAALAEGLTSFRGLPHRLALVAERDGVAWYDDSKGTNVGATVAALAGLGRPAVVILGGEGKGQDFGPLAPALAAHARAALLIGRDAPLIERALARAGVPLARCATLEEAVERAAALARAGDAVLLSPACASFDMFRDYRARGEAYARAVRALGGGR